MIITRAEPEYRPVTIVLETQDEFDMFFTMLESVASNRINHLPQVVRVAQAMYNDLLEFGDQ